MKVQIPQEIKIGGRKYTVELDDKLLRDHGDRGCTYWHKQKICLDSNLYREELVVTFLHECIHVIDEHMTGRANLSEGVTIGLAEGLYQLLTEGFGLEFD